MGFAEFVATIASIMALNPLALDMMLPALPDIVAAFHVANANRAQAILSAYLVGFGVGQLLIGPLSDRFGRRPILFAGIALYTVACLAAVAAGAFETLLLARVAQGLGTSASRVIATAVVRDCYEGRRMASVMSLAQMIFIVVPVFAPSIGLAVILFVDWRGIFVALMLYGGLVLTWIALRMPETMDPADRRSLAARDVLDAWRQTLTSRQTVGYALVSGGVQGTLYAFIFSSQQIFSDVFGLGRYFPLALAVIAIGVAVAGFLNARFVGRLGMRNISHAALVVFAAVSGVTLVLAKSGTMTLPVFMSLACLTTFTFGLMVANFASLAMQPQGHIAGTASSLYGSITTLFSTVIATAIGQMYDGTVVPFATGFFVCALSCVVVVLVTERGRMFGAH